MIYPVTCDSPNQLSIIIIIYFYFSLKYYLLIVGLPPVLFAPYGNSPKYFTLVQKDRFLSKNSL